MALYEVLTRHAVREVQTITTELLVLQRELEENYELSSLIVSSPLPP